MRKNVAIIAGVVLSGIICGVVVTKLLDKAEPEADFKIKDEDNESKYDTLMWEY